MAIIKPPEIKKIPLPPIPPGPKNWGAKLKALLLGVWYSCYNEVIEKYWPLKGDTRDYFLEKLAAGARPFLLPYLDRLDQIEYLPPEVKKTIQDLRGTEPITLTVLALTAIMTAFVAVISGLVNPVARRISQEVDHIVESGVMPVPQAFAAMKRGSLSEHGYLDTLGDAGWSTTMREAWEGILTQRMPVDDLSRLFLRGDITSEQFGSELMKRGFDPVEIGKIYLLLQVIPPLGDIIRMAVREAFTPEVVGKFQLHAELPGDMVGWAKKQGLSEEWARAYWAAHWELPPLTMGFQMLHRGIIDQSTMELLIRTHDVSPFWRDKLIKLSYDPYTRVDVRRMYEVGIVTKEEVYKNYRDLGYDHEKATNLVTFTVALTNEAERDLTKTEVLYGYEVGFFNGGETDAQLFAMGYDQTEADFYKAKVDYKRYQAMVSETVKYVQQQYISGRLDQNAVYAELSNIGLPNEQITRYIREWDIKKDAKPKLLTADRLVKFRAQGVIGDADFIREMSGLGYDDLYIEWYLDSIKKGG